MLDRGASFCLVLVMLEPSKGYSGRFQSVGGFQQERYNFNLGIATRCGGNFAQSVGKFGHGSSFQWGIIRPLIGRVSNRPGGMSISGATIVGMLAPRLPRTCNVRCAHHR